jgi:glycosyltransferase involved in cell wall biosynthesis
MKIGFFTDSYFPQINGVTYTISLWKRELEKLGHEVFLYYPQDKGYKPGHNETPLRSFPFLFYKGYTIGLPSFKKVEKDLDIVHIQSPATMGLFGLAVARKQKIPCIVTHHTPVDMYLKEISPLRNEFTQEALKVAYYKYERELLERCQLVTAPSEEMINVLTERWGSYIKKSVCFSNGIDTEFFVEVSPDGFKKEYNMPEGKIIGYAGRHTTEKHVEDLIEFAKVFDGTVAIGGMGPLTESYKKMAEGLNNVRFIGFLEREKMPEFYSALDLLIMPSTAETEGLVVLEANACGTPAIGADALALKNTIEEGVNGYRYTPGDIKDLGKAVEKAYGNMQKLEKGSKKRARERSVKETAKKLARIYKETKL